MRDLISWFSKWYNLHSRSMRKDISLTYIVLLFFSFEKSHKKNQPPQLVGLFMYYSFCLCNMNVRMICNTNLFWFWWLFWDFLLQEILQGWLSLSPLFVVGAKKEKEQIHSLQNIACTYIYRNIHYCTIMKESKQIWQDVHQDTLLCTLLYYWPYHACNYLSTNFRSQYV